MSVLFKQYSLTGVVLDPLVAFCLARGVKVQPWRDAVAAGGPSYKGQVEQAVSLRRAHPCWLLALSQV